MNLEESDKFVEKQRQTEQKKKVVLASIVVCVILMVLLFIMIWYLQYQDSLKLKMFIDKTQVPISKNVLYQENNTTYINVKYMADIMGYTYTKGEYQKYNEDVNSCYIRNDLEVVAMTVGQNIFTKYIDVNENSNILTEEGVFGVGIQVESQNGESNIYNLKTPMKLIDGQIYMPFDVLTDVFNVRVDTSEQNRIRITTLPTLFKNAVAIAAKAQYTTVSGIYENIRAIPYGLIVVGKNNEYGVIDEKTKQEILSVKYENIEFIQNVQEFFIGAADTVGLIDKEGNTIIKPKEYDEISILDEVEQLYLVKNDGKYGVLNRKGEVIIHVDYDRIGLRKIEDFKIENMRNPYLLHDKCIVVELGSAYGLYSIDGEELLKTVYEELGYRTTSTDISGEESVLILPPSTGIKGIVLKFNELYGIYDINKKSIIIPCACNRIYSITKAGVTKYYMEFGEEQIELDNYLTSYNLKSENTHTISSNEMNGVGDETVEEQTSDDTEVVVENE